MGWLRFFLAASVVISHNGIQAPGISGHLAVMAFFVISGFYMALVLNEKYGSNISGFYLARFLRLWPGYIIVFLVVVMFIEPMGSQIYQSTAVSIYVWFSSLTMFFYETLWWFGFDTAGNVVFINTPELYKTTPPIINATHMQHMWSVGAEICFYIAAPFFARKLRAVVFLLVLSLIYYLSVKHFLFFHHPLDHRSALNHFWLFLMGMVSYFGWTKYRNYRCAKKLNALTASVLGLVIIISVIEVSLRYFNSSYVLIVSYFIFLICIIPVFHATRNSKADRLIGEMSYPIYLTHWPIVLILISNHRGSWVWSFIIVGLSLVASIFLYVAVDKNVEKFRRKLAKSRK
ncbi:acyltransferase [Pantoea sp. BAV 3049]|uniref:acyltransferase family protein n=1 Tax=Pantoea sp. BAV 3049 TaxID=2654188 RepID=UPI00131CA4FB|nr:acyltransferase [Pantoea sp. BAV 3049]